MSRSLIFTVQVVYCKSYMFDQFYYHELSSYAVLRCNVCYETCKKGIARVALSSGAKLSAITDILVAAFVVIVHLQYP